MLQNISTAKVSIPTILFLILSPGMILKTDGQSSIKFGKMNTDRASIFFHTLVFFITFWSASKMLGVILTKADLIVTTTLFLILSPGLLLTLPPGSGGVWMSGQTSHVSIIVHTVVFAIAFAILRKQFPQYY